MTVLERAKGIASDVGKKPKHDASIKYRDRPMYDQRCGLCTMFRSPHTCTAVAGVISPQGWCKIFKRKT